MSDVSTQNARMLASLSGIGEEAAAARLDRRVLVTSGPDFASLAWAAEVTELVERTVSVTTDPARADVELVVGRAEPRSGAPRIWAAIGGGEARVATSPVTPASDQLPHPLFAAAAACPVTAAVLRRAIGSDALPHVPDPLRMLASDLGLPAALPDLDLSGTVLVGAGAVANGFMRALRHLSVRGELAIIDPKRVAEGVLNRCLYFRPGDVGLPKAEALASSVAPDFPGLVLTPFVEDFAVYARRAGPPRRAIVTVDSRLMRRKIQKELPREVIDASTTDARGVIVHSHRQPTLHACMACIYRHVPEEHARERSIAEGLGVRLADVQAGLVSEEAARRITIAHPGTDPASLTGKAYDTLFREFCSAQALLLPEGRQVLAPFAFVSALAGALAAVELLRQAAGNAVTNYWSVDPWRGPIGRTRLLRERSADCEFCSRPESRQTASRLWG